MKRTIILFFQLCCLSGFAQDSSAYTIYYGGNRNAGFIKIVREQNGINNIHYKLNDRGRGADHYYQVQTNANKGINRFILKGINLGASIDSVNTDITEKDNLFYQVLGKDTTKKDFKSSGLSTYFSTPWMAEFFFPAINDTTIHGEVPVAYYKILDRTIIINNKKQQISLYNLRAINNNWINLVWLRDNHRFFAQFLAWNDVIETGSERLRQEIRRINDSVFYALIEKNSAEKLKKSVDRFALTGCNIVDIERGVLLLKQTILVSHGKIQATGDSVSVKVPSGYTTINATGKTVMPGLWDMHAHYFPLFGNQYLANGITSVRDLGNNLDMKMVQGKINQGKMTGPRLAWLCGFIDMNGDMAGPCGVFIDNLQEGIKAIKTYKRMGYQSIKLYSSLKPEYVKPLAAEAHKLGMPVHGHIPAFMTAAEAIQDGYDEINHLNMLLLGHFGKSVDTRTRIRLSLMRERAYEVSPNSEYARQLITLMKEKKTILDPTSVLYRRITLNDKSTKRDSIEKASADTIFTWLKILHQNGIRFIPGTDAAGGNGLVNELKNYVSVGMSNADALRAGTLWSAQYCKMDKILGTVKKGKMADLIIVLGNPLENLTALDKIEMVVSQGKLFTAKDLAAR
jgi:imidazolonepropionase-like amidohydrolase